MMRRLRNSDVGRRGSTAPGPGTGVLLKKLRSRFLVCEPTYCRSNTMPAINWRCRSKLHWRFCAFGSLRVGEIMSVGPPGATVPVGLVNDRFGFVSTVL